MKNVEIFCPRNKKDWRDWLSLNHDEKDSVWLVFYKKKSTRHNLSWSDSVDEALCFGWIDSTKKAIDDEKYKQYFSKRKAKSNWSKVNKDKVATLMKLGLMERGGLQSIEVAKKNGSWNALDEVEALVVPEDLKEEFTNYRGSIEYFNSLSKSAKKGLLHWVAAAKRKETRRKRILEVVESASQKLKPKHFR